MKEKKYTNAWYLGLAILIIGAVLYLAFSQAMKKQAVDRDGGKQLRGLAFTSPTWTGDFDKMLEHRRM